MSCDICKKVTSELLELRDIYQTEDMKMICKNCEKDVDEHLSKVRKLQTTLLQRLMAAFMKEKQKSCCSK